MQVHWKRFIGATVSVRVVGISKEPTVFKYRFWLKNLRKRLDRIPGNDWLKYMQCESQFLLLLDHIKLFPIHRIRRPFYYLGFREMPDCISIVGKVVAVYQTHEYNRSWKSDATGNMIDPRHRFVTYIYIQTAPDTIIEYVEYYYFLGGCQHHMWYFSGYVEIINYEKWKQKRRKRKWDFLSLKKTIKDLLHLMFLNGCFS